MNFADSPSEAAFRAEVRSFIEQHLTRGYGTPDYHARGKEDEDAEARERWRRAIIERGWIAPHWPKEYGGAGMSTIEQFIFNEEIAKSRAPIPEASVGIRMLGPTLILHGSPEQKEQHLPPICRDEVIWCQGYSEPGAGSDLASLRTRAVRDGDDFMINGQKIWTGNAHRADWMFMLARTDPEAPKHRGITMFLLDMRTPGISVSPLVNLAGDHHFNQVFFDNVRVPARNVVGEVNRGWYYGASLLDFERSNIGSAIGMRHVVEDLMQFVRENIGEAVSRVQPGSVLRLELADRLIEADIVRLLSYRIVSMQKAGKVPNHESSINKVFGSDTSQRIARTGMKVIGLFGTLARGAKWAPMNGWIAHRYLTSVAGSIAGGTSEIQRNIIAQRGLALPRN